MCGLCGVLGGDSHWSESASAPDVFANRRATVTHRHERLRRAALANTVLDHYGMTLRDWQGASYVLATRTGRTRDATSMLTPSCSPTGSALQTKWTSVTGRSTATASAQTVRCAA